MADSPFISRQDLTDYLGRNVTADEGAVIACDAACDTVRTLAEQSFTAGTTTVRLDGSGTDTLLLPERPVSAAGTVVVNGGTLTSSDYAVTAGGELIRTTGTATWTTWTTRPPAYWPAGRQNIEITYEHGYDDDDLPRSVRMVALAIASRLIVQGVAQFEVMGQQQVRYGTNSTDLTDGEKAVLRKYKVAR